MEGGVGGGAEQGARKQQQQLKAGSGVQRLADSMCAPHYAASLKCLDDFDYDKSKCKGTFDSYKACRDEEKKQRLERNKKRGWFT